MRLPHPVRQPVLAIVSSLVLLTCAESAQAGKYAPFHIPEARTATQVKASPASLCRPLVVYASRGSDENSGDAKYYSGLGEELRPIYYALADLYGGTPPAANTPPGATTPPHPALLLVTNRAPAPRPSGDPYPATETDPLGPGTVPTADAGGYLEQDYLGYRARGADLEIGTPARAYFEEYNASAVAGGFAAARDIRKLLTACPNSKLLLLGYSEGAEVTRRAIAKLHADSVNPGGRVKTMLFGDVLWKGNEPNVTHVGDTAGDLRGGIRRIAEGYWDFPGAPVISTAIAAIPNFPSGWDVTTWCHGGDLACQFPAGTLIAHTNYDQEDRVGASMRAAEWAGGAIAKPVFTAKLSTPLHCVNWWGTYRERLTLTSPIAASGEMVGGYEPSLGPAFNRTTLAVTAGAGAGVTVDTENPSLTNLWLPTSHRFKVTWNGHKLDYRNRC